jgi:hypothetical protein
MCFETHTIFLDKHNNLQTWLWNQPRKNSPSQTSSTCKEISKTTPNIVWLRYMNFPRGHDMLINFSLHKFIVMILGPLDVCKSYRTMSKCSGDGWIMSQPHFGLSVKMKFTLPKVGIWSPPGLSKTHSSISEVKTPCIEVFFIPLKRSWSVDAQNGSCEAIWTFAAQVMVERRAGSQTGSLTPDH